jgi:hypothetical protein
MRIHSLLLLAFLASSSVFASITGTIINSDGQAIAGAKVSIYATETIDARRAWLVSKAPERSPLATKATDSKGSFAFDSPKEPVVDLRIDAAGFAPDALRVLADEDVGAIALISAPMQKGTITANGKPLAGATVMWSGSAHFLATTDANGQYSAPDPTKWANRLVVFHPDYAILEETTAGFGGSAKKGMDRTLNTGVTISGRLVGEDGQTPVAKASILVDNWPIAATADDGSFSVAHAAKDWKVVEARSIALTGMRAHAANASNVRLTKQATIAGCVRDAKTQLPVAGAEVRIGAAGPLALANASSDAFTDVKGNFSIVAAPGTYELMMTRPGFAAPPTTISVTAGKSAQKTIYASERARILGTVVDEDKRAVAGARLLARATSRDPMRMMGPRGFNQQQDNGATSGPDGRFVLRNVTAENDLQVDATRKGFPAGRSASLRLNPGERKSGVLITIPRGVAFSGKVIDRDGRPVSGVAVEAVDASRDSGPGGMRRVMFNLMRARGDDVIHTGSDGTFTLRLKEGSYDVVFKREGFANKTLRAQSVHASTKPVQVTLDAGVEITGRVTRSGAGVEGANISAMGPDGVASAITAADGSFRITDLTPGPMMLNVNKTDAFIQQIRPVTAPAQNIVIDVPVGGRITGRVVDKESKNPVTSFQAGISASRSGGGMVISLPPQLRPFTSDDGTFALENVPPGPTQVVVMAPGYTTARVPGINVEDGKSVPDMEIALDTGAKLSGRVTALDGTPIGSVVVRLDQAGTPGRAMRFDATESTTVTDPSGAYTLEPVEPGEQTLAFSHQGFLTETRTITLSGKEGQLDVQLSSGTRLSGTVVTDGGAPVPGAMVQARSASDSSFKSASTDSNGAFVIDGVAPGHYNLTANKSGLATGMLRDFDVTAGAPARIVMSAGAVITGHVTGLTDQELQQATVSATSTGGGNASAPVDSGGNYRIEGAPTGTVRLSARTGQGFAGAGKTSPVKSVQVDPGSSVQADLEFKTTTITGRVTRNGQPLSNAGVRFMPRNAQAQTNAGTTTDSNGTYQVSGLDDAPYNVQVVDFERTTPYTTTYTVQGSSSFEIDIKSAALRGRVLDAATGEPIGDAQVQISSAGGDAIFSNRAAPTDPSGNFLIDNVAQGSYQGKAEKEGYGHDIQTVTVGDTGAGDLVFKLTPSSGVTIHVVDQRDNRAIGANVTRVVDAQNRDVDLGSFRFGGGPDPIKLTLSPGVYRVTLSAMGYALRTATITSPSEPTIAMSPGGTVVLRSKSSSLLRARLIDSNGVAYSRGGFGGGGVFTIDPSPGLTTLNNISEGTYQLQILDSADRIVNTISVTVVDGQQVQVDV